MKILQSIIFLCALLMLSSCKKDQSNDVIDAHINLTLLNQQGQNLLSPPSTYDKSNISVYYIVNGQPQLYNQPYLDSDKGFMLYEGGNGTRIRIFTDFNRKQRTAITLVKFGELPVDTIKCEYRFQGASVFLKKVWYNGVLKSSDFTVVK